MSTRAIALGALALTTLSVDTLNPDTAEAAGNACPTPMVFNDQAPWPGCDMQPGNTLIGLFMSGTDCLDAGGKPVGTVFRICWDMDF